MCSSQTITSTDELREARIEKNSSTLIHHGVPFDCGLAIADFGFGTNEHVLYQDNPQSAIRNPKSAIRNPTGSPWCEARRARIFPLGSDSGIVSTAPARHVDCCSPNRLELFFSLICQTKGGDGGV